MLLQKGDVDGLIINPDWVTATPASPDSGPDIPGTCCGGALPCAACGVQYSSAIGDIAMLHLAKPVPPSFAVPAFSVLAAIAAPQGNAPPWTRGAYPVNLPSLVNNVVMMAGTSSTNNHQGDDWRAYGPTSIASLTPPAYGGAAVPCTGLDGGVPTTNKLTCTNCLLNWTSAPTLPLMPNGGACGVPGDSGGPALLGTRGYPIAGITGIVIGGVLSTGPTAGPGCNNKTAAGRYAATWDTSDATRLYPRGTWILQHLSDFDGDTVPDDHDNCPVAPNPDQSNCNSDAEEKFGYPRRGDACDPIPCPHARPTVPVNEQRSVTGGGLTTMAHGIVRRDHLTVTPRPSTSTMNGAHMGKLGPRYVPTNVETGYRYCVNRIGLNCALAGVISDSFYPMSDGPTSPARPFLRPTLAGPGLAGSYVETATYDGADRSRTWNYGGDYTSWTSASPAYIPATWTDDPNYGVSTGLTGRFWAHAVTSIGTQADQNQHGTGCATRLDGTVDGTQLANHYEVLAPDAHYDAPTSTPSLNPDPWFWWLVDKDGDPGPDGDAIPGPWAGERGESALFLRADGHTTFLNRGGRAIVIDSQIQARLATLLSQGAKFTGPAEPSLLMAVGGASTRPRAIAVAADGTDVLAGVARQAGTVGANGPVLGTTEDFGGASLVRGGGPAARSAFRAVYARSIDLAFVIGGTLGTTTTFAADVWARPVVGSGAWAKLATGSYSPQKVLAATYSPSDGRLWILDEITVNRLPTARLVRLDLTTGTPVTVGQWTRGTGWDSQWLVADLDGHVLLFSSSASTDRHAVARLHGAGMSSDPTVVVDKLAVESGMFPFAPVVDVVGYSFPTRHTDSSGTTFDPGRRASLPGTAATLSNLSQLL